MYKLRYLWLVSLIFITNIACSKTLTIQVDGKPILVLTSEMNNHKDGDTVLSTEIRAYVEPQSEPKTYIESLLRLAASLQSKLSLKAPPPPVESGSSLIQALINLQSFLLKEDLHFTFKPDINDSVKIVIPKATMGFSTDNSEDYIHWSQWNMIFQDDWSGLITNNSPLTLLFSPSFITNFITLTSEQKSQYTETKSTLRKPTNLSMCCPKRIDHQTKANMYKYPELVIDLVEVPPDAPSNEQRYECNVVDP